MQRSKWRSVALGLALAMVGSLGVGSAFAAGVAREMPPREVLLWGIAQKVLQKGDEAVLALARLAKARLYLEKASQPGKALVELEKLETETRDPEVRLVVSLLKMVVMEKAETPLETQLEALDRMIAQAKDRREG